jgi:hypothetical protein
MTLTSRNRGVRELSHREVREKARTEADASVSVKNFKGETHEKAN